MPHDTVRFMTYCCEQLQEWSLFNVNNCFYKKASVLAAAQAGFKVTLGCGLSCVPDERKNSSINQESGVIKTVLFIFGTHSVMKGKINNQRC